MWWTPTRLHNGEGGTGREETVKSTGSVHRGTGDGTWERYLGQRGRPGLSEGSDLKRQRSWWPDRESERVIVPPKPGNAGGGKDPHFWNAAKEAEEG
jgi:hypothetical protein